MCKVLLHPPKLTFTMNINSNFYGIEGERHEERRLNFDLIKSLPAIKFFGVDIPDSRVDIQHRLVVKPPPPESVGCSVVLPSRWSKGPSMLMML